jgi:anti-anti-sigma factor
MAPEFSVSIERNDQCNTVHLEGELDLANVDQLRTALADVHGGINLDVRGLSFIDCAGVAVLTEIARNNGTMTIHGANHLVRRVLDICDLTDWLR